MEVQDPASFLWAFWRVGLLRGTLLLLLLLSSPSPVGLFLFWALCNFVLLNKILQLAWYSAWLVFKVSCIPLPSSSLAGSSLIGSWLTEWNWGIFLAKRPYPSSAPLVGLERGEMRYSFVSIWQRQHLAQSVCQDFELMPLWCSRSRVYPFTTLYTGAHSFYGIRLGSCSLPLHLARSFIQCHLSPVRSVHHPDNIEPNYPWLGFPTLAHPVNSGVAA